MRVGYVRCLTTVSAPHVRCLAFLDHCVVPGMILAENRGLVLMARDVGEALDRAERTWLERAEVPELDARLDAVVQ